MVSLSPAMKGLAPIRPSSQLSLSRAVAFRSSAACGNAADAVLEHLQAFGEAEAVGAGLDDVEVDAARPHARLGALLGRVADQRRRVLLLLVDVLADRRDLGQHRAVVELERRALAGRVDLEVGLAPVLAAAQVDLDLGDVEALLGHEHADHARVGPDRNCRASLCSSLSARKRYQIGRLPVNRRQPFIAMVRPKSWCAARDFRARRRRPSRRRARPCR